MTRGIKTSGRPTAAGLLPGGRAKERLAVPLAVAL